MCKEEESRVWVQGQKGLRCRLVCVLHRTFFTSPGFLGKLETLNPRCPSSALSVWGVGLGL